MVLWATYFGKWPYRAIKLITKERDMYNIKEKVWDLLNEARAFNASNVVRAISTSGYTLEEIPGEHEGELYYNAFVCHDVEQQKLTDVEEEISNTKGTEYCNDEFRSLDERGIATSTIDTERRIAKNKYFLGQIRLCWLWYAMHCDQEEYGQSHADDNLFFFVVQTGIFIHNCINADKRSLDRNLGTTEVNGIMNDIIPRTTTDTQVATAKWDKENDMEELVGKDYNKIHWNLAEKHWDNMILKVNAMIHCRARTGKNVNMFKRMYAKLWKEQRARKQISYKQFAQLRYMISSHLWDVTEDIYWGEKADADLLKLEKALGAKNTLGENVPETFVTMDDIHAADELVLTGRIGTPTEDQIIEHIDRTHMAPRFRNRVMFESKGIQWKLWHKFLDMMADERPARKDYSLPTGAENVDVADAMYALVRYGSRKDAAEELGISLSTMDRRVNKGKELIVASPIIKDELAHEFINSL
jgi:hypothetical protein